MFSGIISTLRSHGQFRFNPPTVVPTVMARSPAQQRLANRIALWFWDTGRSITNGNYPTSMRTTPLVRKAATMSSARTEFSFRGTIPGSFPRNVVECVGVRISSAHRTDGLESRISGWYRGIGRCPGLLEPKGKHDFGCSDSQLGRQSAVSAVAFCFIFQALWSHHPRHRFGLRNGIQW